MPQSLGPTGTCRYLKNSPRSRHVDCCVGLSESTEAVMHQSIRQSFRGTTPDRGSKPQNSKSKPLMKLLIFKGFFFFLSYLKVLSRTIM